MVDNGKNNRVKLFAIIYVWTCSVRALRTEHVQNISWHVTVKQTPNHAIRIFTFHHLIYLNTA